MVNRTNTQQQIFATIRRLKQSLCGGDLKQFDLFSQFLFLRWNKEEEMIFRNHAAEDRTPTTLNPFKINTTKGSSVLRNWLKPPKKSNTIHGAQKKIASFCYYEIVTLQQLT